MSMTLPRYVSAVQVERAEALLEELLSGGPARPKDVREEARRRGFKIRDDAWTWARRVLDVETMRLGRDYFWRLPADAFEDELANWLDSLAGRFAVYCAERDRVAPGEQLTLS